MRHFAIIPQNSSNKQNLAGSLSLDYEDYFQLEATPKVPFFRVKNEDEKIRVFRRRYFCAMKIPLGCSSALADSKYVLAFMLTAL